VAKIRHLNCPKCGGTLGASSVERVVECRYCRTRSLVDAPEPTAEYFIRPAIKEISARRIVQALLKDKDLPPGLLKNTRFHSARLCFVPFYELTGRRLGTMKITEFKQQRESSSFVDQALKRDSLGLAFAPFEAQAMMKEIRLPPKKTVDTRVIMSDITRIEPAVNLAAWALEEAEFGEVRAQPSGVLLPMDRKKLERAGRVYDATLAPAQLLSQLTAKTGTAWLDDQTEIAEVRIKRIYYPVWRVRYRYQGRLYGVTLDGVTGKVMSARAPQDDRSRVRWLIGTTAPVAFGVGLILRAVIGALVLLPGAGRQAGMVIVTAPYLAALGSVGLLIALVLVGFGWEQFRYSGELVITGSKREVEKINRPERTFFDVAIELAGKMTAALLPKPKRDGDFPL
jgi:hypothetical protein